MRGSIVMGVPTLMDGLSWNIHEYPIQNGWFTPVVPVQDTSKPSWPCLHPARALPPEATRQAHTVAQPDPPAWFCQAWTQEMKRNWDPKQSQMAHWCLAGNRETAWWVDVNSFYWVLTVKYWRLVHKNISAIENIVEVLKRGFRCRKPPKARLVQIWR